MTDPFRMLNGIKPIASVARGALGLANHPLTTLAYMARALNIEAFTFRTYEDGEYGQGFRDIDTFKLKAGEVVERGVALIERAEADGRDIVVDSLVSVPGMGVQKMHLGLIDFMVPAETDFDALVDKMALPYSENSKFSETFEALTSVDPRTSVHFYKSGHSFHGYVTSRLYTLEGLRNFMATLLVVEPLDGKPLVDHRWVGRRLLAQSGALRLSCVSDRYLQLPWRATLAVPF